MVSSELREWEKEAEIVVGEGKAISSDVGGGRSISGSVAVN
jgi:hypothetical protein